MNHLTLGPTSGAVVRPPTLRRAAKIVTQRRLIASARTLFLQRGYDATTVRDIAANADRSIGAVFNCFADKLDLLEAVMAEEAPALAEAARGAIAGSPRFVDCLHRLLDLLTQPDHARLVMIERHLPTVRRKVQPALCAVIHDAAVAALDRGEIAPHLKLDLICGLVWDLLTAWRHDIGDAGTDSWIADAMAYDRIDLLMTAITP